MADKLEASSMLLMSPQYCQRRLEILISNYPVSSLDVSENQGPES